MQHQHFWISWSHCTNNKFWGTREARRQGENETHAQANLCLTQLCLNSLKHQQGVVVLFQLSETGVALDQWKWSTACVWHRQPWGLSTTAATWTPHSILLGQSRNEGVFKKIFKREEQSICSAGEPRIKENRLRQKFIFWLSSFPNLTTTTTKNTHTLPGKTTHTVPGQNATTPKEVI